MECVSICETGVSRWEKVGSITNESPMTCGNHTFHIDKKKNQLILDAYDNTSHYSKFHDAMII